MSDKKEQIHTKIWQEIPAPGNPFIAETCYCSGFDVHGDLLGKVSWIEYLYLLFNLEPPTTTQTKLLEGIAIALANPGPRDYSVRAAMNGAVGGSTAASCLIAALAPGAGQFGGARELYLAMELWERCDQSLNSWQENLLDYAKPVEIEVWPDMEHPPGFDPYNKRASRPVLQTLDYLCGIFPASNLSWVQDNRVELENSARCAFAISGVAAAAFADIGFNKDQGELLYLLLRLPGAAAHSLEQRAQGWKNYPFFGSGLKLTKKTQAD